MPSSELKDLHGLSKFFNIILLVVAIFTAHEISEGVTYAKLMLAGVTILFLLFSTQVRRTTFQDLTQQ